MSHPRNDDDVLSEGNSLSVQSNDADSDDSSWNDESDVKRKPNPPRSQSKPHKSKCKSSKKKRRSNRKNIEKTYSDVEIAETVSTSKSNNAKQELKEESSIKSDHFSDDVNSVMSDINPPSFATRSRRRRFYNRQAWKGPGSTSSNYTLESDGKKAKSEPILITIDSDSEDDHVSTVSSLPSRSARLKGEMLRKLQRMSGLKKNVVNGSSSSSDSENPRKSKKKTKSSAPLKKIGHKSSTKGNHRHLKHKKSRKALIFTPSHKRHLKIHRIKKRLERQKIEKRVIPMRQSRITPSQSNTQPAINRASSSGRRSLRNNSSGHINYQEEEEDKVVVKLERRTRRSLSDYKNIKEEPADNTSKRRISKSNVHVNDEFVEESKFKETVVNEKESEQVPEDKNENIDTELQNTVTENSENTKKIEEKLEDIKNDIDLINNMISNKDINEDKSSDVVKPENSGTKEASSKVENKLKGSLRSKIIVKKKLGRKKKIIAPPPSNIRRPGRGRPRKIIPENKSESKPDTETFNILNIKPQVPFLQNSFCFDVAPKLAKCRECRLAIYKSSKRMYNSYCRFMEYRKLCYNKSGMISSAGFSNPNDAAAEHLSLWFPQFLKPPKDLNIETAKSLLEHIGDQFCDLVGQEREALNLHIGLQQLITWKRVVQGVREMCDVCSTTIFNIHWVCPQCGLAVCIDCYKVRKQGEVASYDDDEQPKDRDEFKWLLCTMRTPHRQDSLVMAQIIPGTALWMMRDWLHKAREKWNIPSYCKCTKPQESPADNLVSTGIVKQLMCHVSSSFNPERIQTSMPEKSLFKPENYDELDVEVSGSALRWLDNSSIMNENPNRNSRISDDYFNSFEDLIMLRGAELIHDSPPSESDNELSNFSLDDIIASVKSMQNNEEKENSEKFSAKHFSQRYPQQKSGRDPLPIRIYTKIESKIAFPSVPHSWFCNGRLLFLHQATHPENLTLFQEQWKRGQPILVKSVDENLDMDLWTPDGFSRDFGEVKNDLVDCKTGNIIKNLPMKKFWEGFENLRKRLTDENDEPLLLKLKDWPPGEDFSEKLPTRFENLMKGLPLPEYTHRDGILNLAGRLPSSFVRPDLGPKMYNAYGSALFPTKGTTNLHLDVSDAVNVMVYVGIPSDDNSQIHVQEALKAIDEGGCDSLMRARVRGKNCKPGALWHIYNARDADKIRQMLNKVAIERGEKLEPNHDPIHDQSWYIDSELRLKLYREYGVEGYAIAQCLGDAVFIPAGAPHQVRNLHSCVKVAEDFVSPENIAHCFKLTQEFRQLSDTHTNHEDKLQIKNIIYHVVKDALSHLLTDPEAQSAQASLL